MCWFGFSLQVVLMLQISATVYKLTWGFETWENGVSSPYGNSVSRQNLGFFLLYSKKQNPLLGKSTKKELAWAGKMPSLQSQWWILYSFISLMFSYKKYFGVLFKKCGFFFSLGCDIFGRCLASSVVWGFRSSLHKYSPNYLLGGLVGPKP